MASYDNVKGLTKGSHYIRTQGNQSYIPRQDDYTNQTPEEFREMRSVANSFARRGRWV